MRYYYVLCLYVTKEKCFAKISATIATNGNNYLTSNPLPVADMFAELPHNIHSPLLSLTLRTKKKQPLYACPGLRGHLPTGFGQMRNWHQNFLSFKKSSTLCSFFSSKETFLSIPAIIFSCFPYNFHEYIAHKRIFYLYLHCLNNLRSRQRGDEELGKTIHLWKASPDVVKLTS